MRVYLGDVEVSEEAVIRTWEYAAAWWRENHGDDWGNIEWTFTFQDTKVPCTVSESGWCYGVTWVGGHKSKIWVNDPCLARTALLHEIIHTFEYMSTGWGDVGHKSPDLWTIAGGSDSFEAVGGAELAKQELCW